MVYRFTKSDRPVAVYVEDDDGHFSYIAPIIHRAGYDVVRATGHDVLPDVLKQNPETNVIISDINTNAVKAGLGWADGYRHESDHKPFLLISDNPHHDDAGKMGAEFVLKPMIVDGEPMDDMPGLRRITREFSENLTGWLKAQQAHKANSTERAYPRR